MRTKVLFFNTVQILSLIVLITTAALAVPLVLEKTEAVTRQQKEELFFFLEEATGLKFTYTDFSPYFFTQMTIKNLKVSLPGTPFSEEKVIGTFKTIRLQLNMKEILTAGENLDPAKVIEFFSVEKGDVNLDLEKDLGFLDKLALLSTTDEELVITTKFLLKDLSLMVKAPDYTLSVQNLSGQLNYTSERYSFSLKGDSRVVPEGDMPFKEALAVIETEGSSSVDFSDVNLSLSLERLKTNLGVMEPMTWDLEWKESTLKVRNRFSRIPLDLTVKYRTSRDEIYIKALTDNFTPGMLFTPDKSFTLLDSWEKCRLTGTFQVVYNIKDGTLLYDTESSGYLENPDFPASGNFILNATGNQDIVSFKKLRLNTTMGQAAFYGSLDLKTFFPRGSFSLRNLKVQDNFLLNTDFKILNVRENYLSVDIQKIWSDRFSLEDVKGIFHSRQRDFSLFLKKSQGDEQFTLYGNYNLNNNYFNGTLDLKKLPLGFLAGLAGEDTPLETDLAARIDIVTDFKDLEYTLSQGRLALDEKKYVEFSLSGDNSHFYVKSLEAVFNDNTLYASGEGTFSPERVELKVDTEINDNYYFLSGIWDTSGRVSLRGSYGLEAEILLRDRLFVDVQASQLPVKFQDYNLVTTLDIKGLFPENGEFMLSVEDFKAVVDSQKLPFTPGLSFSGEISHKDARLSWFQYSDGFSTLDGSLTMSHEPNQSMVSFRTSLANRDENYSLSGWYNYGQEALDLSLMGKGILLSRLQQDGLGGRVDMDAYITGSLESPEFRGSIETDNLINNQSIAQAGLSFTGSNKTITLKDIYYRSEGLSLTSNLIALNLEGGRLLGQVNSQIDLEGNEIAGSTSFSLTTYKPQGLKELLEIPLRDLGGTIRLSGFTVNDEKLFSDKIIRLQKEGDNFQFRSSLDDLNIEYNSRTGAFSGDIQKPWVLAAEAEGTVKDGNIQLILNNIDLDLDLVQIFMPVVEPFDTPVVDYEYLNVKGGLMIKGAWNNPDFFGLLEARSKLQVPFVAEEMDEVRFSFFANGKKVIIQEPFNIYVDGINRASVKGVFLFNQWIPSEFKIDVEVNEQGLPGQYFVNGLAVEGDVKGDVSINWNLNSCSVTGAPRLENARVYFSEEKETERAEVVVSDSEYKVLVNLKAEVGRNNMLYIPNPSYPLVTAIVKAGDVVDILFDSSTEEYVVAGTVAIKHGTVNYLQKEFALTKGGLELNINQNNLEPEMFLTAELDTRDNNGRVLVTLNYRGGLFSEFKPEFSSFPSRSEEEILALLGKAIVPGLESTDPTEEFSMTELLLSTSADAVSALTISSPVEEVLKELLGVDSVRFNTDFIKNVFVGEFYDEGLPNDGDSDYNVSKYLSNTSLSIGKYIAKDLFLQSSVGTLFDEDTNTLGFDAELKVELNTPLFLLGWGIKPAKTEDRYFPQMNLSLSWEYEF